MKSLVLAAALLLCAAAPAFAADVDGKWSGTVDSPMGPVVVSFDLKADGTTLTGTTSSPDGGAVAIKNGKIDGNKISFGVTLDFGGMPLEITYTGVVAADSIAITGDAGGFMFEFVVKKAG